MKVTRQQAEENRARVVAVASQLFREEGFDGVGVADIMRSAGLTHGGFYGNFASKSELEREAVAAGFAGTIARLRDVAAGSDDPLRSIVRFYLSPEHRDQPGVGCVVAALAADGTRSGPELRDVFDRGIKTYLALLSELPEQGDGRALATLSILVGALTLARTVTDRELSDRILEAAAQAILTSSS